MSRLPRGGCSRCGQYAALRRNGTLREHRALSSVPGVCPGSGLPPRAGDLRAELLRENHGDPLEAAGIFAVRLMRDDPATLKVGYNFANALGASKELFPELDPVAIGLRMESIHPGLLTPGVGSTHASQEVPREGAERP